MLQDKLQDKLAYDRVFYGNAFNAISLGVQNGVVTLGGHALSLNSRDRALGLVSTYPGVKGVVDEMQVFIVSVNDWGDSQGGLPRHLRLPCLYQVRHRSRQAYPDFSAERQRGALRLR